MEQIDPRTVGMAALTLISRLARQLERQGLLAGGWTAAELHQAADQAQEAGPQASNPDLQHALAQALRTLALHFQEDRP